MTLPERSCSSAWILGRYGSALAAAFGSRSPLARPACTTCFSWSLKSNAATLRLRSWPTAKISLSSSDLAAAGVEAVCAAACEAAGAAAWAAGGVGGGECWGSAGGGGGRGGGCGQYGAGAGAAVAGVGRMDSRWAADAPHGVVANGL